MMKIKKYLLYLLILIVAGVIIVGIFYAVRDRRDNNITDEDAAGPVESVDDENEENIEEDSDAREEGIHLDKSSGTEDDNNVDYYKSSSTDFEDYGFILPEGWVLYEENSGKTVLIRHTGNNGSTEDVMVMVEDKGQFESLDPSDEIIDKYMQIKQESDFNGEAIDSFYIKIGKVENEVNGYFYNSGLGIDKENEENIYSEIDLFTCLTSGEHVYIVKYMGSMVEKDEAVKTFSRFLSDFFIGNTIDGNLEADKSKSVNILILGVDSGLGREWSRENARSDINIIVHINLETYKTAIITIPRDLWVPIAGHSDGKINGAYAIGGPKIAVETFENFTGLDIDNYIITDFDGFIPLIDFLGGVTIEVTEDLADGFSNCYLSRGVHHLDGEQALALCRNRHRNGDGTTPGGAWAREKEAAKVIKALYEQKTTFEKIISLPAFVNFLLRYTWTDMDFKDVVTLLPALGNIESGDITIRGVPSYSKMIGEASAVVHYEEETKLMFEEVSQQ
jgi:LCP family protein required for cell wall assembly